MNFPLRQKSKARNVRTEMVPANLLATARTETNSTKRNGTALDRRALNCRESGFSAFSRDQFGRWETPKLKTMVIVVRRVERMPYSAGEMVKVVLIRRGNAPRSMAGLANKDELAYSVNSG
jgi:hypothetical protein